MNDRAFSIKVLVAGAPGAGTTSFVRVLSDAYLPQDRVSGDSRSAATDFGHLALRDGEVEVDVGLVGAPGAERFAFMRGVLSDGMDGYVVVVDGGAPRSADAAHAIVEDLRGRSGAPFVVAVNRAAGDDAELARIAAVTGGGTPVTVVTYDVSDPESARLVLIELLRGIVAATAA